MQLKQRQSAAVSADQEKTNQKLQNYFVLSLWVSLITWEIAFVLTRRLPKVEKLIRKSDNKSNQLEKSTLSSKTPSLSSNVSLICSLWKSNMQRDIVDGQSTRLSAKSTIKISSHQKNSRISAHFISHLLRR